MDSTSEMEVYNFSSENIGLISSDVVIFDVICKKVVVCSYIVHVFPISMSHLISESVDLLFFAEPFKMVQEQ